jgi:outer membrane receptor protein involved in Fe transport
MRRTKTLMSAAITLSASVLPLTQAMADTGRVESHIPAQDLDGALQSFASVRGIQLQYQSIQVQGLKTSGVDGNVTAEEELRVLLTGTGLTFQFTGESAVTLVPTATAQFVAHATKTALGGGAGDSDSPPSRLAQAGQGTNPSTGVASTGLGDLYGNVPLDEVIVLAQKRSEQLLTVPVPVTVLEASDLENYNQLRFQDYFQKIPGVSIAPSEGGAGGNQQIAVRGIIAGQGLNPTVGVTIDGVPYGSSISNGGGNVIPDIDPSELARVELLRGPQGTLYGANSLGGQLQYVTVDPSTDDFTGRVSAGASDVRNGDHAGYNTRAAVNIPITDDLAVRASGFTRRDPGYIDDVTNNVAGINERDIYGGHFSALWRPTADFSAKFSAIFQRTEQFGQNFADVTQPATAGQPAQPQDLSRLVVFNRVLNSGVADNKIQNYSLTLDDKIGTIDLTSISSFSQNNEFDTYDSSVFFSYVNACLFPTLVTNYYNCVSQPPNAPGTGDLTTDKFTVRKYTQELRLTTPLGKHVDWLFGLFYSKEISELGQDIQVANPQTGANLTSLSFFDIPMTDRDEAVFTDFTFKIDPKFDVQVGGRANINRQHFSQDVEGGIYNVQGNAFGTPGISGPIDSKFTSYTYLLTPRYFLLKDGSDTVMTYARFASGFRPGGPNAGAATGPGTLAAGIPLTYGPDKTYDYDLGVKADLLDRRLTLDVSLFYIDWKNIQISESVGSQGGIVNGSRAKSQGLEFQTEVRPLRGLTIDANFTYDDARLRTGLNASGAFGNAGDRLPFTSQYTGNLDVNQEFPLPFGNGLRGFVAGELSYVGGRPDLFAFSQGAFRQDLPAYTQVNTRAGVSYNTWTAQLYATNVTDRRGFLSGGVNEIPPTGFYFITPRTVGFEVSDTF